jgi:hypothetical protein
MTKKKLIVEVDTQHLTVDQIHALATELSEKIVDYSLTWHIDFEDINDSKS